MLDTSCDDQLSVFNRSNMTLMVQQPMIKDHGTHLAGHAAMSSAKAALDAGKYVRYTAEQVQALERLYNECPKPSSLRRQQLVRDYPILQNIEPKQIKVWFQNRRCREKQRKETSRLQTVNSKLTAMNKLLMEENDRLQKQVAQLMCDNRYIRQQLQHGLTTDTSCDSVVTSGLQHLPTPQQQSPLQDGSYAGIMSLAQEILSEFLGKASGTAMDWIQMPGMKPGPDSTSMVNIAHGGAGIAARACGLITMEPAKIAEVIKDKPSWHRECRRMTVMFSTSTNNGGSIEVLYTQMYAPTTLALAKDFYTLRYTSVLDDGSFVVCERSFNNTHAAPMVPHVPSFARAEMHVSGCLVRPCEGSGSIVIVIDHMDLESWNIPEILRPLYESSASLAHKFTIAALKHLRHIAQESLLEAPGAGQQPTAVRSLSHRLARGFNDAVNGFPDDGWTPVVDDGIDDVTVMVKHPMSTREQLSLHQSTAVFNGGILCAKASMLLQNVPPAFLVRFLREHRSEWTDNGCEEAMRIGNPGFSGFNAVTSNSQLLQPQVHAIEEDEFLELIKMEGQNGLSLHAQNLITSQDMFLLQLCSGLEENDAGACAQMVFAPIDASVSDDIALVPSGFRVIPLHDHGYRDETSGGNSFRTLDLASALDVGNASTCGSGHDGTSGGASLLGGHAGGSQHAIRSVLTIAFQFSYTEACIQESIACISRQYVRNVVSCMQRVAVAFISTPPRQLLPQTSLSFTPSSPTHLQLIAPPQADSSLARSICRSYKFHLGVDLVRVEVESNEGYLKALSKLGDAVMCCSCKVVPMFTFANKAGLDMLEISTMTSTSVGLLDLSLDKTLDEESSNGLSALMSQVMQQGYACLPTDGMRLTSRGRPANYERAIAWKVSDEEESACRGVAFLYVNWALV